MTYADRTDKILMGLGFGFAILTGAGMPSMVFLLGNIIDSFSVPGQTTSIFEAVRVTVIAMVSIGAFIWFVTYIYFVSLVIMAERITKKTRVAYLRAILR
jgi:ABC-type multidrug transport system fused ATPase/permease subunit